MRQSTGHSRVFALAALLVAWAPSLQAQVADPDPQRFAADFAEFAAWDAKNYVPKNAIVFVGASSIVRWNTAASFPDLPVINRGFGGSQASDAMVWLEESVLKYDPSVVVYYEGDNDVEAGKKSEQIFADMREFVEAVLAADPSTQIILISPKPSLRRWQWWFEMQATHALMRQYADSRPTVQYLDVGTDMLGADGQPMPQLFVSDGLHMTPAGYEIWNRIVGRALTELHIH